MLAVLAAAGATGTSRASNGTFRVLVVKVTWDKEPFSNAAVDSTMKSVARFLATASFGQFSIAYAQTPWLKVLSEAPACGYADAPALGPRLASLAKNAGYDPRAYDRLVFLLPEEARCGYSGQFEPGGIILDGVLNAGLVLHELGESLGVGDVGVVRCRYTTSNSFCHSYIYGAPWDAMAGDCCLSPADATTIGDFGALQKATAGWLTSLTDIGSSGTYTLGALEQETAVPQALVIQTAEYQYWVDHREAIGNDAYLASDPQSGVTSGFAVYREAGDPDLAKGRDYPLIPDYLLPQGRQNRYITGPGETFTLPNVFELTELAHRNDEVTVRFRWLDHTRPGPPAITVAATSAKARVALSWPKARDTGTGVEDYLVSVDGRTPTPVSAQPLRSTYHDQITGLTSGRHTISVTAVDYAQNRSRPARRTVTVP